MCLTERCKYAYRQTSERVEGSRFQFDLMDESINAACVSMRATYRNILGPRLTTGRSANTSFPWTPAKTGCACSCNSPPRQFQTRSQFFGPRLGYQDQHRYLLPVTKERKILFYTSSPPPPLKRGNDGCRLALL